MVPPPGMFSNGLAQQLPVHIQPNAPVQMQMRTPIAMQQMQPQPMMMMVQRPAPPMQQMQGMQPQFPMMMMQPLPQQQQLGQPNMMMRGMGMGMAGMNFPGGIPMNMMMGAFSILIDLCFYLISTVSIFCFRACPPPLTHHVKSPAHVVFVFYSRWPQHAVAGPNSSAARHDDAVGHALKHGTAHAGVDANANAAAVAVAAAAATAIARHHDECSGRSVCVVANALTRVGLECRRPECKWLWLWRRCKHGRWRRRAFGRQETALFILAVLHARRRVSFRASDRRVLQIPALRVR